MSEQKMRFLEKLIVEDSPESFARHFKEFGTDVHTDNEFLLRTAIKCKANTIATYLCEQGADVNHKNIALSIALSNSNEAIYDTLKQHGLNFETYSHVTSVQAICAYAEIKPDGQLANNFESKILDDLLKAGNPNLIPFAKDEAQAKYFIYDRKCPISDPARGWLKEKKPNVYIMLEKRDLNDRLQTKHQPKLIKKTKGLTLKI